MAFFLKTAGLEHRLDYSNFSFFLGSSPASPRKPPHPVMDFFSSNLLVDSSSPGSNSSPIDAHEIIVTDFVVSDENLQKMENVLDLWSSGLKVLQLFNIICNVAVFLESTVYSSFLWIKKLKTKQTVVAKDQSSVVNLGFSVVTAHMNHLGVLINSSFLVSPGPRCSTANKLPGE